MTMLVIQSVLLLAIAFILGCMLGALAKHRIAVRRNSQSSLGLELKKAEVGEPSPKHQTEESAPHNADESSQDTESVEPKKRQSSPLISVSEEDSTFLPFGEKTSLNSSVHKDDLKLIKGIGAQNEKRLNEMGVSMFSQIAKWSDKEQQQFGERLAFPGRIEREKWVKQAAKLAHIGNALQNKSGSSGEMEKRVEKGSSDRDFSKPAANLSEPSAGRDNLTLIDGIGNALESKLNKMGVFRFSQIASWNIEQQTRIGEELGFPGRPQRENWVAEAELLASTEAEENGREIDRGEIVSSTKS